MRPFIYIAMPFLLLLAGACSTESSEIDTVAADSSFRKGIDRRLLEKRELEAIRLELHKSPMGRSIQRYKPIIKKYAKRYGFDWRLIAAQIVKESGFREKARSQVGARGLMQLMPRTAKEISRELDIIYIMKNPRENITAGIYHLSKQYKYFPDAQKTERIKFALASYNCGAGRVFDAQNLARYHQLTDNRWDTVSPYLRMLKKTDWQVHLQIWPEGKPRYGYFYGYDETLNYVNNIWTLYEAYRHIL